ncbi:unnamed protein product [Rotaria sp. Silwood2]|nr:unnamed protein product [Rotaria sp. Silwood2]CAF4558892.1 unnamed protein product [Rotaria sp. Silwood2]
MTNQVRSASSKSKCDFVLNINDHIPDDAKLTATFKDCAIHEANSVTISGHTDGSCYAEVFIDYDTKMILVELAYVNAVQSVLSPYDDMFGVVTGIKSVVQYRIIGNFKNETIFMRTRIQCNIYDNCALDKLRKLLSNLTISETRLNIFKKTIKLLHTSDSIGVSGLSCINNNTNLKCSNDEQRCAFFSSKDHSSQKGCLNNVFETLYDIRYRFNVIEEIASNEIHNFRDPFKFFYLCNTNFCNNNTIAAKVSFVELKFK